MAFNMNDRHQPKMFPAVIDDYVVNDAPVRVYDAFVDALDFDKLGIKLEPNAKGGADQYYPKDLMKLLLYGYSYGIRSSRKLERACYDNVSFIWLMGGLKPDYRTIARFRIGNKEALKQVMKQCVRICMKLDLVEGNMLFVDGSKFRADASINNTWDKERCEKSIKKIEEQIEAMIEESAKADAQEMQEKTLVKLKEDVQDKAKLINKIKDVLSELEVSPKGSINSTDGECVNAKTRQGSHAVYNVQNTVDGKHGLIVNTECVSEANDAGQLSKQLAQAEEVIGRKPEHLCADAGYSNADDLKKIDQEINVVVPSKKQAQEKNGRHEIGPFEKGVFRYEVQEDRYICPTGQVLKYTGITGRPSHKRYQAQGSICGACEHFGDPKEGKCTQSPAGRRVIRLMDEEFKEMVAANYLKEENQKIYAMRKEKLEHIFGHVKRNLGAGQFLLRGVKKVQAEASMLSVCFNVRRMMTIVGNLELLRVFQSV
jgi:transposase